MICHCRFAKLPRHLAGRALDCLVPEQGTEWRNDEEELQHHFSAAIIIGNLELVKGILRGGLDPNIEDRLFGQPLQLAAQTDHVSIVELLMEAGANVHGLNDSYTHLFNDEAEVTCGQPANKNSYSGKWNFVVGPLVRAA